MQSYEMLIPRHNNPRLHEVFPDGDYQNVEHTMPAEASEIIYDPQVSEGIRTVIADHVRTIITPDVAEKLGGLSNEQIRLLASPYECGRVLEADQSIFLNGQRYTLTVKGVGCTGFIIQKIKNKLEDPRHRDNKKFHERQINELETFRMLYSLGVARWDASKAEMDRTLDIGKFPTTKSQKVLAIAKINNLIGPRGEYLNEDEKRERGLADGQCQDNSGQVQIFRAMKSNFRVLDLWNLLSLNQRQLAERLADYGRRLASEENKSEVKNFLEYAKWFIKVFLSSELPLILMEYPLCNSSNDWEIHARNISIMAEELDLEDVPRHIVNKVGYLEELSIAQTWADLLNVFVSILMDFDGAGNAQNEINECVVTGIQEAVRSEAIIEYMADHPKTFAEKSEKILIKTWMQAIER